MSVVTVVCCQVEVSVTGRSLVQRGPTKFGVSECDREASLMIRPWATRGFSRREQYTYICVCVCFLQVLFCSSNPYITFECTALMFHASKFSTLILELDQT